MTSKETFLVTGANGFIGGWLAEIIYLSCSAHVRAGIRTWSGGARPARFPMEIALCDVLKPQQIESAMRGVSCAIHCAKGPSKESIIQGTQNALEAALKQRVRRFVYLSTTEVYGNQTGEIDETTPLVKTGNPYGDSKIEAESLCWQFQAKGLPVTVIRPPIVYGPFSKTWTTGIALKLQSGNCGILKGVGDGNCNLIYITDLVSAILLSAHDERAAGQAFNLNGPEALTWNQYFQRFNAALGLPELKLIEPAGATLRAAAMVPVRASAIFARDHFESPIKKMAASSRLARHVMKYLEQTIKWAPRLADFNLYRRKAVYLTTKAQDVLGFKPVCDLDAGLKQSVHWLRQLGFVA